MNTATTIEAIGVGLGIVGAILGGYIGMVRSHIEFKKDLDSAFDDIRGIKENHTTIEDKIEVKTQRMEDIEKMLYAYLKKHEAEEMFAKKEIIAPIIDDIKSNQEKLHLEVKDFRDDVLKSLEITTSKFDEQMSKSIDFQKELLLAIKNK